MSTYKLYYFNGRGRAEVSRLIFAAAGQQYEDVRYEREEFPSHKAEMPLGQVPLLEVDGVKLPQSVSIARFLARRFGLAGQNDLEQAQADAVVDTATDLMNGIVPVFQEQDPTKKQELTKKFFDEDLPKHLHNLEVLAKSYGNGGAYFVGNNLTWADLYVHSLLDYIVGLNENSLNNNAWIKQNRETVEQQPKIAEYLKNRPKTAY